MVIFNFPFPTKITRIYESIWIQLDDIEHLKKTFKDELYKFIYYYELFFSQITRDDEYRAFMNYMIAFYKLVGLMAMVEGEYYNIYQPKEFTTKIVKNQDIRESFYGISTGLRKKDMLSQENLLISLFFDAVEKGKKCFNLGINISHLKECLLL